MITLILKSALLVIFGLINKVDAHTFVLGHQISQLTGDNIILCRFCGCELSLTASSPLLLPDLGKYPCAIIFGTKFKETLADDNTVRCVSRKPGRDDYLWYDIELVVEPQNTEDLKLKEAPHYHWDIKKRELDQVPLRIPDYAIIVHLPAAFIDTLTDEHGTATRNTFYLPSFTLKKDITTDELEDFLIESDMRHIKDKRFFSNNTLLGGIPPAVQILNS